MERSFPAIDPGVEGQVLLLKNKLGTNKTNLHCPSHLWSSSNPRGADAVHVGNLRLGKVMRPTQGHREGSTERDVTSSAKRGGGWMLIFKVS